MKKFVSFLSFMHVWSSSAGFIRFVSFLLIRYFKNEKAMILFLSLNCRCRSFILRLIIIITMIIIITFLKFLKLVSQLFRVQSLKMNNFSLCLLFSFFTRLVEKLQLNFLKTKMTPSRFVRKNTVCLLLTPRRV